MKLGVYFEGDYSPDLAWICEILHKQFPVVECTVMGSLDLPATAWDTHRGQFDVHYLLDYLPVTPNTDLSLWVVNGDIGDPGHLFLFGAAGNHRAIVSRARLAEPVNLAKEVCHEVGHLLGLGHCSNECFMKVSWSSRAVEQKKLALCPQCLTKLNF